jgi:hypothetical protein
MSRLVQSSTASIHLAAHAIDASRKKVAVTPQNLWLRCQRLGHYDMRLPMWLPIRPNLLLTLDVRLPTEQIWNGVVLT